MAAQPLIRVTDLKQVGYVVASLDQKMETMWNLFGIGPWSVYIHEQPDTLTDVKYYGKPSSSGVKLATANVGAMQIALVEPYGTDNIYRDFLDQFGEGIQHLGHKEVESPAEFAETTAILERGGFPTIWSGYATAAGVMFAYVDTTKALNTILEVTWRDPTAKKPIPKYIFPAQ